MISLVRRTSLFSVFFLLHSKIARWRRQLSLSSFWWWHITKSNFYVLSILLNAPVLQILSCTAATIVFWISLSLSQLGSMARTLARSASMVSNQYWAMANFLLLVGTLMSRSCSLVTFSQFSRTMTGEFLNSGQSVELRTIGMEPIKTDSQVRYVSSPKPVGIGFFKYVLSRRYLFLTWRRDCELWVSQVVVVLLVGRGLLRGNGDPFEMSASVNSEPEFSITVLEKRQIRTESVIVDAANVQGIPNLGSGPGRRRVRYT